MKTEIAYTMYRPEGEVKVAVVVVHGMEEHRKRYADLGNLFKNNGIAVLTYDLPGHGDSVGEDGMLGFFGEGDGWQILVDSAVEAVNIIGKEYPGVPVWYFGHSMGTIIGRTFLQKHDDLIDGMVLSGVPNYNPAANMGIAIAKKVIKKKGPMGHSAILDKLATGSFNKAIKHPRTKFDWLSVNTDNVNAYISDPKCGVPFTASGYLALFEGMMRMGDAELYSCTRSELPILMFAGEEDPCIGGKKGFSDSVHRLLDVGYNNISFKLWPGDRHETMHEDNAQEVMEYAMRFILAGSVKHA